MISGRRCKSSPSHIASSSGYFCDASTTDETDESSEFSSPHVPTWSGIVSLRSAHPEPHYQFRKSNSMKLALKEDDEQGYSAVLNVSMQCHVSGLRRQRFVSDLCFCVPHFCLRRDDDS